MTLVCSPLPNPLYPNPNPSPPVSASLFCLLHLLQPGLKVAVHLPLLVAVLLALTLLTVALLVATIAVAVAVMRPAAGASNSRVLNTVLLCSLVAVPEKCWQQHKLESPSSISTFFTFKIIHVIS